MKSIFRTAFYLRSNYVNKEGKTPVMMRIYLNSERLSLGSTGITIVQSQWDREKERMKGRKTEALNINLQLDNKIKKREYPIFWYTPVSFIRLPK